MDTFWPVLIGVCLCVTVSLASLIWSSILAMWMIPGPLIFSVLSLLFAIISTWGQDLNGWLSSLSAQSLGASSALFAWYLVSPLFNRMKIRWGESGVAYATTATVLILSFALFAVVWARWT